MTVRELPHAQQVQACINLCTRCQAVCLGTASHYLERGGAAQAVTTLLVCADTCRACADTLLRGSALHRILCRACAEVCAKCAAACEALDPQPQLKECTAACLGCFDACAAMASAA
jgi:hypothetical protein